MKTLLTECFENKACRVSESIWINEGIDVDVDRIKGISEAMEISSYQVEMGDESTDVAIQKWINDNTGSLLWMCS